MNCRHCDSPLKHVFLDLGFAPPSNAYRSAADLCAPESYFPLRLFACTDCWLVQTEDYARAEQLFDGNYAYFSSVSLGWLKHAEHYTRMITARLGLNANSHVIEIASNDGYLLKNFVASGIPCLGVEPTASTAAAAEKLGIPVLREFFGKALGERLSGEGKQADLIIGNNVVAHVPDINDFCAGIKAVLKSGGTVTLEFPHLLNLVEQVQFDTVYHEHFSYLSLHAAQRILAHAGLQVYDVEALPTHGGSLRIYAGHAGEARPAAPAVATMLNEESKRGMCQLETYSGFQSRADRVKDDLLEFLITQKRLGKKVAAYGAAAKGNTLLNYAGIKPDLLPYVCDAAPSKQGKFLPGSHIPIFPPNVLAENQPDIVVILPWNLAAEVAAQQAQVRGWGGRFAIAIPTLSFLE